MAHSVNLNAAETFIWLNARLIDRHRYAYLFKGGDAGPVVAALGAYQNADGGFGNALEPDGRGWSSQPAHVSTALTLLDEAGQCRGPMVTRAIDYLATVTAANGGVPVALPSINEAPKAPWWNVGDAEAPGSLLPTATIAGLLHKNKVEHPWLTAATAFCWPALAALEDTHPYEIQFCLPFLDHAPDRDRAAREAERLGRTVRERRLAVLDPAAGAEAHIPSWYGPGEFHTPLDYVPHPDGLARRWFTDEEIEQDLDALAGAQRDDGGWMFRWREWNPMTTLEWRGAITIHALTTLRAYGRVKG